MWNQPVAYNRPCIILPVYQVREHHAERTCGYVAREINIIGFRIELYVCALLLRAFIYNQHALRPLAAAFHTTNATSSTITITHGQFESLQNTTALIFESLKLYRHSTNIITSVFPRCRTKWCRDP